MQRIFLGLVLVAVLTAGNAHAVLDPDPDMVSIYFDTEANVFCVPAPVGPLTAYLCITNATSASGILGWEAFVWVTPGINISAWNLSGTATNTSTAPDFTVQLAAALPWQQSLVVMEFVVDVPNTDTIEFIVYPAATPSIPGHPSYVVGNNPSEIRSLGYSGGTDPEGNPLVCAIINGDCAPVPDTDLTWGKVKAMFR